MRKSKPLSCLSVKYEARAGRQLVKLSIHYTTESRRKQLASLCPKVKIIGPPKPLNFTNYHIVSALFNPYTNRKVKTTSCGFIGSYCLNFLEIGSRVK